MQEAERPLHLSEAQVLRLKRRYQPDLLFFSRYFSSVLPVQVTPAVTLL